MPLQTRPITFQSAPASAGERCVERVTTGNAAAHSEEYVVMPTPFRTERMFHDTHGWYASLRPDDAASVRQMYVPGRRLVDKVGLVVGPFPRRDRLEAWLEKFIDLHGTTRMADRMDRAA